MSLRRSLYSREGGLWGRRGMVRGVELKKKTPNLQIILTLESDYKIIQDI